MSNLAAELPDMQNQADVRGKKLYKVGIRDFYTPIRIREKDGSDQTTIGSFSVYTSLSDEVKGANMSRYGQTIIKAVKSQAFALDVIKEIMPVLKEKLGSENSYLKIRFPYFIDKKSPTTENTSPSKYNCVIEAKYVQEKLDIYLTVEALTMSLCPCSKRMSQAIDNDASEEEVEAAPGYGAHNQRSIVRMTVHMNPFVWIEDLVKIAEEEASCEIYNILKRPDEKYVTEKSYANPKFVEDTARDVSIRLDAVKEIDGYVVVIENEESIHQYNAVAVARGGDHFIP